MGRIVVTEFISLDGVVEAPGGEPFRYPNWGFEYDRGEEGEQFKVDETLGADTVTYQPLVASLIDRRLSCGRCTASSTSSAASR